MSQEFAFLFGVHNHQPVGNFGWVFENAVRDCYLPFLRILSTHPTVKFSAHYSGPLLEFLRERHSEVWDVLGELTDRGQVELLGGGFYEPILAIIPEADRRGQIEMMSEYLGHHFGRRPRGLWLTERVWEPMLAQTLAVSGIEYTLLDEDHFRYAGVRNINEVYLTEDEGFPVRLMAIDQKLRYLIPFGTLAEIETYLAGIRVRGGLAVLGDDGEKFGLWPGTKEWVYEKGWLERFLVFLEDREIRTLTYAEAIDERLPKARIYPPPASYGEMMEWVLEPAEADRYNRLRKTVPDEDRRFLRGGFFRDFFRKYPESRHLRDRMIQISRSVRERNDPESVQELYQGQGNDPFWHGVFGGLYLPHLREAAYEHLLKSEARVPYSAGWRTDDLDLDGRAEFLRRDDRFGMIVKPDDGGSLVEIDYYPLARNLSDVLSRRLETYHRAEATFEAGEDENGKSIHERAKPLPPDAARLLRPDREPRRSSLDRFFDLEASFERFRDGEDLDRGDFTRASFSAEVKGDRLILTRIGRMNIGEDSVPLSVRKEIVPEASGFRIRTTIRNEGTRTVRFIQAVEWNLYQTLEEIEVGSHSARLCRGRLALSSSPETDLWMAPLQTLSQSEKDYDIIHQGVCLTWIRRIELAPGESVESAVELKETHGN
jgi:hypothetical protein